MEKGGKSVEKERKREVWGTKCDWEQLPSYMDHVWWGERGHADDGLMICVRGVKEAKEEGKSVMN